MGQIVGAAIVSHHPGLGAAEGDPRPARATVAILTWSRASMRAKIDEVKPDTFVLFDTHRLTTSLHLVAGAAHYKGSYTSDELPFSMTRFPYDHAGAPALAAEVEKVAQEKRSCAQRRRGDAADALPDLERIQLPWSRREGAERLEPARPPG